MSGFIFGNPNGGEGRIIIDDDGKHILNTEEKLLVFPMIKHQKRIKMLNTSELGKFLGLFFDYLKYCEKGNDDKGVFIIESHKDKEMALVAPLAIDIAIDLIEYGSGNEKGEYGIREVSDEQLEELGY